MNRSAISQTKDTGAATPLDIKALIAVIVCVVLWASAFAGIRAGLTSYTPGHLALLRFLVASLALLIYALITRMRLPHWRDIPVMLLLGFSGLTIYHIGLNYGEQTVSPGAASFLIGTVPCFTAILAILFLGERLSWRKWLGILVSLVGIALIASGEDGGLRFSPGVLLILLAALAESVYSVLQKPLFQRYTGLEMATYTIWSGTLFMLIYTPGLANEVQHATLSATLSVIYLGIFPAAIAYVAWSYTLSRMPASRAVSFLNLIPVLAVLIAWSWIGDIPVPLTILGGVIIIGGILLVNMPTRKRNA